MLYSTQAHSTQAGPRSAWPWFFLCLLSLFVLGMAFLATWPGSYPLESELVKVGGGLRTSLVRDDFSDTEAGATMPVMTSVYMRFRGDDREYRYPWQHAKYYMVREYTSYNVDVWVMQADLDRNDGTPVMIWALEERNPHKPADERTIVTYQENIVQLDKNASSLMTMAKWLGGAAFTFLLIGVWTVRWNHRNYPDNY